MDVGLEAYLPRSWHDVILGQTSPLTHTPLQHSLDSKGVDIEQFFTARRLLGWVHSLDRIQVPQTQLETWLVQREPGPITRRFPDAPSLMDRTPAEGNRVQRESTMEQGAVLGSLEEEERTGVDRSGEWEFQSSDTELQWQDLMDILGPENTGVDMTTSLNRTADSRIPVTSQGVDSEQHSNILGNAGTADHQAYPPTATFWEHDLLGTPNQLEQEPVLLPLTPSDELEDPSSLLNTVVPLENSSTDQWRIPSNYTALLLEEDVDKGRSSEENVAAFSMNHLTQHVTLLGSDSHSHDLNIPSFSQASEGNDLNQDFGATSSSSFVLTEEDADGLPSQISDILEDFNLLEDLRLLDGALEEGFSPDLEARLEDVGCPHDEGAYQGADRGGNWMEEEDGRVETDSDSGLSLDFVHSPSTSSSLASGGSAAEDSSRCASALESLSFDQVSCSEEEGSVGSGLEVDVTIKQEEMGAVGGRDAPLFSANHQLYKQLPGFSWLEHIGHDHTYNDQPVSLIFSPAQRGIHSKQTKPAGRHTKAGPGHGSETKPWNRDEQRARALRIPFSCELIVSLPVEEFNLLLSSSQLTKEQLTLIRDIRRRGKNKVAAQNCRKRKQDVLLSLEEELKALRRHRSRLLREKRSRLGRLQDIRSRFGTLYREIFSRLADDNGRPLDATEYKLHFGPNDTVTVASLSANQNSRKQKGVRKRRS